MCLIFRSSSSEIDKDVAPCGLPLYVLYETEHLNDSEFHLCAQTPSVPRKTGAHIMSNHDMCEDG